MPVWRRSKGSSIDDVRLAVTRRRFLRAAGVGTAGAVVAAGAVAGQAGAEPEALAVSIPSRRRVGQASPQGTDGTSAVQAVSGPLSLHTISPKRYVDTRYDGGGPFPPQGATGEVFIWDFGLADFFPAASPTRCLRTPSRSPSTSPPSAAGPPGTCAPSPPI
jgi:hypothetical protein